MPAQCVTVRKFGSIFGEFTAERYHHLPCSGSTVSRWYVPEINLESIFYVFSVNPSTQESEVQVYPFRHLDNSRLSGLNLEILGGSVPVIGNPYSPNKWFNRFNNTDGFRVVTVYLLRQHIVQYQLRHRHDGDVCRPGIKVMVVTPDIHIDVSLDGIPLSPRRGATGTRLGYYQPANGSRLQWLYRSAFKAFYTFQASHLNKKQIVCLVAFGVPDIDIH